jgi:archaellum component FlaF (FlaF/FlaG flagellin family)
MGLSVSASVAIIFVASAIVFGTLLGAFNNAQHSVLDAQRSAQERAVEETYTHLTITNLDIVNGTLTIKNEGDVTLNVRNVDLFINGTTANDRIISESIDGSGPTDLWMPGEELIVSITGDLTSASIKVVCENGISAHF